MQVKGEETNVTQFTLSLRRGRFGLVPEALYNIDTFHHIYLVQKETQCFCLQFLGLKIIDYKNCFNSVVLPSNKDIDCIVSS